MSDMPQAQSSEGGAPEWMVSYADMITIMMAFFVVLYATSSGQGKNDKGHETAKQEQKGKEAATGKGGNAPKPTKDSSEESLQKIMDSLYTRFGPEWTLANCWFGGTRPRSPLPGKPYRGMGNKLSGKTQRGAEGEHGVGIPPSQASQYLVPGGRLYFEETSAALTEQGKRQARAVADDLAGKLQRIELRGHTTARPLPPNSPYHDHDDLAYARCRKVRDVLLADGIDPRRIRISVAAENEPAKNPAHPLDAKEQSRVDIHLLNEWIVAPDEGR